MSSDDRELAPFEAGGNKWRVFVSALGEFEARHDELGAVRANTYDALPQKARNVGARQKVRVSVPYAYVKRSGQGITAFGSWKIVRGTATGIHQGNQNVVATEGGKPVQITSYGSEYMEPLSAEDAAELIRLLTGKDELEKQAKAIRDRYVIRGGLKAKVARAIEAARAADDKGAEGGGDDA